VEYRGFWRIQILRLAAVEHPAAEADDAAAPIADGEHHAPPEAIPDPALAVGGQPRGNQQPGITKRSHQAVAARWRESQPILGGNLPAQAAPLQVVDRQGAVRMAAQPLPVVLRSLRQCVVEWLEPSRCIVLYALRQLHPGSP